MTNPALLNTPEQLATLLESLSTAVIVFDTHGHFIYLNQAAERQFSTSRKVLNGKRYHYFIVSESLPLRELIESMKANGFFYHDQLSLQLHNGQTIHCAISARWMDSSQQYLIIESFEANSIKKHRHSEFLHQQNAVTNQLVQQLAHEIKNPLSGLKGAAQLLSLELPSVILSEHRDYLDIMDKEINRLSSLVDSMLFKRQQHTKLSVNIHEIIDTIIELATIQLSTELKDYPIEIQRDFDPSLPEISLAPEMVHQALLNLVNNAIEASVLAIKAEKANNGASKNTQKKICIQTRARQQFTIHRKQHRLVLSITVIDHGGGVPDELKDSIFYPLISSKKGTTNNKNSGLGLSIAQDLIQQQQGQIEFSSSPTETCFSILLPYIEQ